MRSVRGRRAAGRRVRVARRGFTLVETLVGIMLIAVVVTSVFSLVLTSRVTATKSERRGQGVIYMRRLVEALRPYVRADPSAPGPSANWHLTGDTNAGWALAAGNHDVSSWLSSSFCATSVAASVPCTLTYTVTDVACGGAACTNTDTTCCKQVAVSMSYKETSQ